MKYFLHTSTHLSVIQNFFKFNGIACHNVSLWVKDLIDLSTILPVTNSTVIIDYVIFKEIITVEDSIATLLNFFKFDNRLIVYQDIDSAVAIRLLMQRIASLDQLVTAGQITLISDAKLLVNNLHNVKIKEMPVNWFMQFNYRKSYVTDPINQKDFILTIARRDLHRDLLWGALDNKKLLSNGFCIYHGSKNQNNWLGNKATFHTWHDGHLSMDLYSGANFEIVPETTHNYMHFVTEKTLKPIACQLPFLVLSTPGYLSYLKSFGFETFGNLIDESYDLEPDLKERTTMLVGQVERIITNDSKNFYQNSREICKHNYLQLSSMAGKWQDDMDQFITDIIFTHQV